jgi:hypothetical protein
MAIDPGRMEIQVFGVVETLDRLQVFGVESGHVHEHVVVDEYAVLILVRRADEVGERRKGAPRVAGRHRSRSQQTMPANATETTPAPLDWAGNRCSPTSCS